MRYVAIDYGQKRVGLAGSDSGVLASPLEIVTIHDLKQHLQKIVSAVQKYQPEEIILGLPVNENQTEGPQAVKIRRFKADLEKSFPGIRITIINEHLTSIEAKERAQRKAGQPIDDFAAAIILEQFFNQQASKSSEE